MWAQGLGIIGPSSHSNQYSLTNGTDSSIWILDLARTLPPAVQFDGFDISAEQFPCQDSLPENITFQQLDALKPLPDPLLGQYDVVHVRLFCTIVRGDDASPLVANLTKMLSK